MIDSDDRARLANRLVGRTDLALAAAIVCCVALMIVPLPTWLLDILLAGNLAGAIALLAMSVYLRGITSIATLPVLLLLSTLTRLSLNVSSTRLILLQADAGAVIRSFGEFVVAGNYVVGAVIFAVITIIQFVVIAKGTERVAEVSARFSLDAMPGRQLAIDADVRAGTTTAAEAAVWRKRLLAESRLYGAMDGAMKFVKGDAIAGLAITAINIVGGLAVGVGQHGMAFSEALSQYTLLTIGDGLVSQLPALVITVSAGVIVTRVDDGDSDHLGTELVDQLLRHPAPLFVTSGLLAVLAAVPGLPALPLGLMALVAAGLGWMALRRGAADPSTEVRPVRTLVTVGPQGDEFAGRLAAMTSQFGMSLVEFKVVRGERDALHIDGVPVASRTVDVEPHQILPDLLGIQETADLLARQRKRRPATVDAVVPAVVTVPRLTRVLRRLLAERISVAPLHLILDGLAHAAADVDDMELGETARRALSRQITHEHAPDGQLDVIALHPEVDAMIRDSVRTVAGVRTLSLGSRLRAEITDGYERAADTTVVRLVLTSPGARPFVAQLLSDYPDVVTLSTAELMESTLINRVATLSPAP